MMNSKTIFFSPLHALQRSLRPYGNTRVHLQVPLHAAAPAQPGLPPPRPPLPRRRQRRRQPPRRRRLQPRHRRRSGADGRRRRRHEHGRWPSLGSSVSTVLLRRETPQLQHNTVTAQKIYFAFESSAFRFPSAAGGMSMEGRLLSRAAGWPMGFWV
jgi:hypothetical protein